MDERNSNRPQGLTAATIGLTVTLLISLLGPLTMACFNPARDLGPRLFSALAGWGSVPFNANGQGWWTVYIVAPIIGGQLGGAIYPRIFQGELMPANKDRPADCRERRHGGGYHRSVTGNQPG